MFWVWEQLWFLLLLWEEWPGIALFNGHWIEVARVGRVVGLTFISDYQVKRVRIKGFVIWFILFGVGPLLTPSSKGRWMLSKMARRGRWGRPRSLRALWRGPEPFIRRIRALAWLRGLWSAARDLQHNWRAVLTRDAGGWSGFWRLETYVYRDVRQCSTRRGLYRVCLLSAVTLR